MPGIDFFPQFQPMNHTHQLADHLHQVFNGGNWTWSNVREVLADVTVEEANITLPGYNSIVGLTYHIWYFVNAVNDVLRNAPLTSKDSESFDHPVVSDSDAWEAFRTKVLDDAATLSGLMRQLPEERLLETFVLEKYGNYYRNLLGIIEHAHYHLGQIVIVKKLIRTKSL
jgi:hypothetical protein